MNILAISSCDYKSPALGPFEDIIVFAENNDWNYAAEIVHAVYEREAITPQIEKTYNVSHPEFENRNIYEKHHTIIILGTLESGSEIEELFNDLMTPREMSDIESGEIFYLQKRDVWASGQYVLILAAPTKEELLFHISQNSSALFKMVDRESKNYQKNEMFARLEQVDLSKEIFEKYGFTFRIQHDYFMKEWPDSSTVFLRRFDPERMLTIHWVDTTDAGFIPRDWVIEKRQELGRKLLDGRIMDVDSSGFSIDTFADYSALVYRGIWINPEKIMGGPLVIYTFYDETTGRVYMVDLSVFAPAFSREKVPFIRQLEIMAGTFTTNPRNVPR